MSQCLLIHLAEVTRRRVSRQGRNYVTLTATARNDDRLSEIAGARAGDTEALGRALESCRNYLLMVAARELDADLNAKGSASDLVQETFLGAYRDFGGFRGSSNDELLAWLRKILFNNLAVFRRRYRRTRKREVGKESPLAVRGTLEGPIVPCRASATPRTGAVRKEQAEALLAALERLPETYRSVVVWHQYDQLSFEEIGQRLKRSAEASRKLWSRALLRLTVELGPAHDPRR
jgi:RNA polymerase sigma-70 factor (ECF subfamily)